jgi:hypothetical protein
MIIEGFEKAIVGIQKNTNRVVYSNQIMVNILIEYGMNRNEAIEYLEHNFWSFWIGENNPIYMNQMNHDELIEMTNENMD